MNDDPLSQDQREKVQARLQELKRELEHLLNTSKESASPVSLDQPIGRLTRMDAIQQQQMAKANRAAHELRLRQVKAALGRVQSEEFGECRTCGEYISFDRLMVRPEAPFCLPCQEAREQEGRR